MTYKNILISPHARRRLLQRGINRVQIRWLLAMGTRVKASTRSNAKQRWKCSGYLGRNEAEVIFIEDASTINVITVTWVNDVPRD